MPPHGPAAEAAADHARCRAVLVWHAAVLGVMLPVLVAGHAAPLPLPSAAATEGQQAQAARPQGKVRRAAAGLAGGFVRLDAALQACCQRAGLGAAQLALACCLIAANLWSLAKGAALRGALLGGGDGQGVAAAAKAAG